MPISQYDPSRTPGGVTAVQTLENPLSAHYIVAATAESTLRYILAGYSIVSGL